MELAHSPVTESAFHWQPVRSTKKMAAAHTRSGMRGRPPPKGCVFWCTGKSGSMSAQSSSVSPKQPPVLEMRLACGRVRAFFLAGKDAVEVFTPLYRISPPHYSDRQLVRLAASAVCTTSGRSLAPPEPTRKNTKPLLKHYGL